MARVPRGMYPGYSYVYTHVYVRLYVYEYTHAYAYTYAYAYVYAYTRVRVHINNPWAKSTTNPPTHPPKVKMHASRRVHVIFRLLP